MCCSTAKPKWLPPSRTLKTTRKICGSACKKVWTSAPLYEPTSSRRTPCASRRPRRPRSRRRTCARPSRSPSLCPRKRSRAAAKTFFFFPTRRRCSPATTKNEGTSRRRRGRRRRARLRRRSRKCGSRRTRQRRPTNISTATIRTFPSPRARTRPLWTLSCASKTTSRTLRGRRAWRCRGGSRTSTSPTCSTTSTPTAPWLRTTPSTASSPTPLLLLQSRLPRTKKRPSPCTHTRPRTTGSSPCLPATASSSSASTTTAGPTSSSSTTPRPAASSPPPTSNSALLLLGTTLLLREFEECSVCLSSPPRCCVSLLYGNPSYT
mmetsp:Transcript_3625/g.11152  ORF Transcript_3625/g.11152 Transcript_3625/m.11152 type:complete len:321 (+) Transcript_3625:3217-4179(+)